MGEFWTVALPILLVDIANPVLLAAVVLAVSSDRPYAYSFALLAGHTLAYFAVGAVIVFGVADFLDEALAPLVAWFNNPSFSDYVWGVVVGVLLVWIAFLWRIDPPAPSKNPPEKATGSIVSVFGFGAVLNFIGIPFALPYFGVLSQLMRLEPPEALFNLVLYNVAYAIPFLAIPLAYAFFGQQIMPVLKRVNAIVEKYAAYIMPAIFGVLGLLMIADSVLFFFRGKGLI